MPHATICRMLQPRNEAVAPTSRVKDLIVCMLLLLELTPDVRMLSLSTIIGSLIACLIVTVRNHVPFGVVGRMGFPYPFLEWLPAQHRVVITDLAHPTPRRCLVVRDCLAISPHP